MYYFNHNHKNQRLITYFIIQNWSCSDMDSGYICVQYGKCLCNIEPVIQIRALLCCNMCNTTQLEYLELNEIGVMGKVGLKINHNHTNT